MFQSLPLLCSPTLLLYHAIIILPYFFVCSHQDGSQDVGIEGGGEAGIVAGGGGVGGMACIPFLSPKP